MIPWNQRTGYLKISRFGKDRAWEWYDWLINEWIPAQPDYKECMRLFIGMKFNPTPFILVLRFGRYWITKWYAISKSKGAPGDEL